MNLPVIVKPFSMLASPAARPEDGSPRFLSSVFALLRRRTQWMMLAMIVGLALGLRLFYLGEFPDTVNPDECSNMQDVLHLLHGRPPHYGFFGFDWKPQPAFSMYLLSLSIKIFGVNVTAIRLPSALLSVLALIPFYFLLRRQFCAPAALASTFLLATNLWYLNFSRSGWENVHVALYMLMAMLCLLLALDRLKSDASPKWQRWALFAATGFFCTLGLYGYFGGRTIIIAIFAFLPVALWFERQRWKPLLVGYGLITVVAVVLFWPQAVNIWREWEFFNRRSQTVLILNSPDYKASPAGTMWSQVSRNAIGFWYGPVNHTPRYTPANEPLLDRATGGLVLVGMLLSLAWPRLRRRPETWLWWTMLVVSWALTQVLTGYTPDGARGVGWMPTLLFFAAVSLDAWVTRAGRLRESGRGGTRHLAIAASSALVLLIGIANVYGYVRWQNDPQARAARYPYVEKERFDQWAKAVSARVINDQAPLTGAEWEAMKQEFPIHREP